MSAGYFVELAENDRRAREVLASHQMAITIVVLTAGAPIFDPGEKGGTLVIATQRSQKFEPAQPVCIRGRCLPLYSPRRAGCVGSGRVSPPAIA